MKKRLISICLLLRILPVHSQQEYDITRFGAGTDSTQLNTTIIQAVIDKAHESGGGTIIIPKGTFLTGALFFKPGTQLRLLEGAVLKGSDAIENYPLLPSRMEGKNILYYAALINAYYADGFSISGPGTINGNGTRFWQAFWAHADALKKIGKSTTNLEVHRPRLLFIWGCHNVTIRDVKLYNAGYWTTHLYRCHQVLIEGCDIRSPFKPVPAPSTDGVDIDACKAVTIRNCSISVNDDAVCIKGGKGPYAHLSPENGIVEDVLVENCSFGEAHATLTMGSESIHAKNIVLRNCKVESTHPLLKLKMRSDTYQVYENITVEGITGSCGSLINLAPWRQFTNLEGSREIPFGTIRNITMKNIRMTCQKFGELEGNAQDKVEGIVFKNITVAAEKTGFRNKYPGVKLENVLVNGSPLPVQ